MDVFPGVGFVDSACMFTVNFNGPFLFDPTTIPSYHSDTVNRIATIPKELIVTCLAYGAKTPIVALNFRKVNFQEISQILTTATI